MADHTITERLAPDGERITRVEGDLLHALGIEDDAETISFRVRLLLLAQLRDHVQAQHWTQAEAARALGVAQPRISEIVQGKARLFSIDKIVDLLGRAGVRVDHVLERGLLADPA